MLFFLFGGFAICPGHPTSNARRIDHCRRLDVFQYGYQPKTDPDYDSPPQAYGRGNDQYSTGAGYPRDQCNHFPKYWRRQRYARRLYDVVAEICSTRYLGFFLGVRYLILPLFQRFDVIQEYSFVTTLAWCFFSGPSSATK